MVSLKTVAAACDVSVATVSKALNDHKDIGEETKNRIRQTAKELGYTPNIMARSLKTNRTYNLGILFADEAHSGLTHDYFASVLDNAKQKAEQLGYDITFINSCKTRPNRMSYLDHCRMRRFDGIMIACVDYFDPEVEELIRSDIPVVMIDHIYNDRCSVVSDNIKGIHDLVRYIYECGHRKIAYIHGEEGDVTNNRISSFYRTCDELSLKVPDEYIGRAPYRDTKTAYEMTLKMLELPDPPTCILYPDDFSCFGGINAINAKGLKVPEDVSVAGYDGITIARQFSPRMTTLEQDTYRLGTEAITKLISLIENPKTTFRDMVVVPGKVFKGETVSIIKRKKESI